MAPGQPPERRPRVRRRLRTPGEAKAWRRRLMGYGLIGLFFVVMVNALVGEGGYLATLQAGSDADELSAELHRVTRENEDLLEKSRSLREDRAALESAARDQGFIYPGETVVILKDPAPVPSHPTPPAERGR